MSLANTNYTALQEENKIRAQLYIDKLADNLRESSLSLNCAIEFTPTSDKRNRLTELNIQLQDMRKQLAELSQ